VSLGSLELPFYFDLALLLDVDIKIDRKTGVHDLCVHILGLKSLNGERERERERLTGS
jgi:hypothetical protein